MTTTVDKAGGFGDELEADHHHHHHDHEDVDLGPTSWRDGKRYAWLLGIFVPLTPFVGWGLVELTGFGGFWFLTPFVVFVIFPLLDVTIGLDPTNPPDSVLMWLEQDRYYRWITFLFIPIQYLGLIFACWQWAYGGLAVWESIGLMLTIGVVGGIAINTAHELGHKRAKAERWLSRIALAQTGYGHFFIEHNRGHHVRVATPEDPASSRMGESFWFFLPRTIYGSLRSAWGIEAARLDRLEASHFGPRNDILTAWVMTVLLFAGLTAVFGWVVLPYLVGQAVVGFCLLEVVNYLEHYGLLRQRLENGRYERCRAEHSWNNNNVASNVLLFHLQRHSDHHAHPTRRYQALQHKGEAPQLPTGYAGMIVLAWFPPLWRRVMDPRLLAHYDGDVTRANLDPRRRDRLIARYGGDG
ncbi:MAG: alkane 1-monooxygenase [Solirubrobacterales bacterium]|nr:alkane 1-monooxygenase [Solirubrobacterales bacterium]